MCVLLAASTSSAELIKSTYQRALIGQVEKFDTLANQFRSRYGHLPGDMPNATSVFGKDAAHCPNDVGEPSATGTCNGNGDGLISGTGAIGEGSSEALQFWRQMALAGLIEGNYSGVSTDAADTLTGKRGSNLPPVKGLDSTHTFYASWWDSLKFWKREETRNPRWSISQADGRNIYILGGLKADGTATDPVMTPMVAYNIDTKLDDGVPNTGKVKVLAGPECTISKNGTVQYSVELKANACALVIRASF